MTTSILPDDSVVVRLPDRTVHVDATARWVYVRATHAEAPLGGSLVASHRFDEVRRLRVVSDEEPGVSLLMQLKAGGRLFLGRAPSSDVAMLTGRAVADLCRCQLDAGGGTAGVKAASAHVTEADTFESHIPPRSRSRASRADLGDAVVPLSAPPQPAAFDDVATDEQERPASTPRPRGDSLHRVTREIVPKVERPRTASAPARGDSLHRATRELMPGHDEVPVFGALLRESELAAAMDPASLARALDVADDPPTEPPSGPGASPDLAEDLKPTQVGIQSLGAKPEAVAELLDLAAERLPVATAQLASGARRGRSRARPAS